MGQLVLAALLLSLPVQVLFSQAPGEALQYALAWLVLAGGGLLFIGAGRHSAGSRWLAHRSWMAASAVVVVLVTSAGVLGGSSGVPGEAASTRLMAGAGMSALVAVLGLGLMVPSLRRRGGGTLVLAPLGWAILAYTLMYTAGSGLGALVRSALHSQDVDVQPGTPLWSLLGGITIEVAMLLCVVALVPVGGRVGLRDLGLRVLAPQRVVLVGVGAVGLSLLSDVTSSLVASWFGIDPVLISNAPRFQDGVSPSLAQAVIGDAVAPGVVEELFFRGVLFGCLVRARQPLWLAVLVSSGLFAIGHLTPDMSPVQLVGVGVVIFISGSVFAATYWITGSLFPGMVAHVLTDLPVAVGLALGASARGSAAVVLLAMSLFAWLLLGSSAFREYLGRPATARNRAERLRPILVRLSPRVRLGLVEISPVRHLLLIGGVWLMGAAIGLPDAFGFSVLVYTLFQGARALSEGARAAAAVRLGGRVVRICLAPLVQVELSETAHARRGAAAAGIAVRIALGLGLVRAAASAGSSWPVGTPETVTLLGWLYVEGSLLGLLPFSGDDFEGALLWGRSWAVRPAWLPYALLVLVGLGCAGMTAMQFPSGYLRAWLTELAQPAPLLITGMWVATVIVVLSRLKLLALRPPAGGGVAAGAGSLARGEAR